MTPRNSTLGAFRSFSAGAAALNAADRGLLQLITLAACALLTLVVAVALGADIARPV